MIYCMTSIFLRRNFSSESLLSEKELYSTAYKNFSQHGASQPTMAKSILPPVQSNFLPAHKSAFFYNLVCWQYMHYFFPAKTQSIFSRPLMFFYKLNNKKCINWYQLKWHVKDKLVALTLKKLHFSSLDWKMNMVLRLLQVRKYKKCKV